MTCYPEILKKINDELAPFNATLVAVSKYTTIEEIKKCYEAGQRHFGESRVQDLIVKAEALADCHEISWHFIGTLQKNKINHLLKVKNLTHIHSVDSVETLKALMARSMELSQKVATLIQVNTSQEVEKGGVSDIKVVMEMVQLLHDHPKFFYDGLMTMGSIRTDDFIKSAHESFSKLAQYKKIIDEKFQEKSNLSMGMSSDYQIALTYGATYIRIGSMIFSP